MSAKNRKDDSTVQEVSNKNSSSEKREDESSRSTGASGVDDLESSLKKLKLRTEKKKEDKILNEVTLDGIIEHIKQHDCKNIIVMAGAGISTAAGIPDFRSPGSGLYDNLQKYNLPHPQAVFELEFFHENPRPFFALAKELYPGSFRPTISHYFVRLLHEKGLLLRHYTQNIDTLERIAGIPEEKLVEAHGTFHLGHCILCRKQYSQKWMKDKIFSEDIPICEDCPGVVKPDIVFFGENLPDKFYRLLKSDFAKCDLLIIMGSSLVVQPFASLVDRVKETCPRILINREKAGQSSGLLSLLGMNEGMDFDNPDNHRDVFLLGDCDDGALAFAKKLGWKEELLSMVKNEHKRLAEEEGKTDKKKTKAK